MIDFIYYMFITFKVLKDTQMYHEFILLEMKQTILTKELVLEFSSNEEWMYSWNKHNSKKKNDIW